MLHVQPKHTKYIHTRQHICYIHTVYITDIMLPHLILSRHSNSSLGTPADMLILADAGHPPVI